MERAREKLTKEKEQTKATIATEKAKRKGIETQVLPSRKSIAKDRSESIKLPSNLGRKSESVKKKMTLEAN